MSYKNVDWAKRNQEYREAFLYSHDYNLGDMLVGFAAVVGLVVLGLFFF